MPEHVAPRLGVHVRLERVLVLEGVGANRGRARADKVEPPLQIWQNAPSILAQDERHGARPAPRRHICNRVVRPEQVGSARELRIENTVVSMSFELVAIDGVYQTAEDMPPERIGGPSCAWLDGDQMRITPID